MELLMRAIPAASAIKLQAPVASAGGVLFLVVLSLKRCDH
jgi:hypothetical protein